MEGPRAAKLEELPEIIRLANSIFMSKPDVPPIMGELFPQLFNKYNLENLRVIVENGKPVSHVGVWEGELLIYGSWLKVGMIGSVCTHPDYRGRGYASTLVRDAFLKMKRDGVDLVLVSGFRNLYRRAGCVEAGRIHIYEIPQGKLKLESKDIKIISYERSNVRQLIEIYQNEPVRYRRSLEEFKLLAERRFQCRDADIRIYISMDKDKPLAYIITGWLPLEKIIVEYAGPRDMVLHLIDEFLRIVDANVKLIVPSHDARMINLLENQGLKKPQSEAPASMTILNPHNFLEKIKPYLEERIGKEKTSKFILDLTEKKIKLVIDGEEVDFEDSRAVTLLFFGVPEKLKNPLQPKVIETKPDLKFLINVLPLPTPIYGLNYI